MGERVQVWSCGGGVQSAAIGALIVQGRLPKPDLAVIADTEREREATWGYFDAVLHPQLAAVGVDIVRVRKSDFEASDLWQGDEEQILAIPAYYNNGGTIGRTQGKCSDRWKTRVVRRWLRAQGVKQCAMWLGISTDELRRLRVSDVGWIENRYPLVMEIPMRREGCERVVREMGWPPAPRSACFMCPNANNAEWARLRDHEPEDFARAVELEASIRARDPRITLHRSGLPLDQAPIDEVDSGQLSIGDQCAGMCWV